MSLPYFPMYPTDFEAKTSHLTLAEDGAYNRLLRICWMTPSCTMPADEAWIMRRARAVSDHEQESVRAVLAEFFTIENGRYSNARLRREWLAANEAHERRKNAGAKGGKAKSLQAKGKTPSKAKAMPKQPEPEPEPDIKRDTNVSLALIAPECVQEPDRFQEFWDQYPHRGGAKKGKASAQKAWAKAVRARASPAQIIAGALRYAGDRQVMAGYAKDPASWLNQKGWEDEVEPDHGTSRQSGSGPSGSRNGMVDAFAAVAARYTARDARN
jgi:uncharacterized protein YdaU (DUF1376 family)